MTAILFFLIPWEGKATGLSGDVIYLQGEEWVLLDKPINRDSILFHRLMEFLPDNKVKIPDFTGLDMRQTAELVQRGHLVLVPYGSGRAKKQSLPPGTVAAEGTKLEIWFE